jgi:hypothetical protein
MNNDHELHCWTGWVYLHEWRNEKHGGDLEKALEGGLVSLACCNIPHALQRKATTRIEYSISIIQ